MNLQTADPHYHASTVKGSLESSSMIRSDSQQVTGRLETFSRSTSMNINNRVAVPSKTIPISGARMSRSPSQLALEESERIAEHRDYCMYTRIVNGIMSSSSNGSFGATGMNDSWQSNDSLQNIIKTRHTPIVLLDENDGFKPLRRNGGESLLQDLMLDCQQSQPQQQQEQEDSEEGIFDMEL